MKTTALRLYGKNDLRLESFELPEIKDNELDENHHSKRSSGDGLYYPLS